MKFSNFIGVRFIQDLIAQKYNQDFMDIRQWWDDHNSGARVWDIVSATLGYFGNGTVSLPSITFASDTDTGWYRIGANNPGLSAGGTKVIDAKSTGVAILGTTTNDSAATGNIGEHVTSGEVGPSTSTTGQYADLGSISLTAGDWIVSGSIHFVVTGNGSVSRAGISTNSGNNSTGLANGVTMVTVNVSNTGDISAVTPMVRISLAAPATAYLKQFLTFTTGTMTGAGSIKAWRIR